MGQLRQHDRRVDVDVVVFEEASMDRDVERQVAHRFGGQRQANTIGGAFFETAIADNDEKRS